MKNAAAYKRNNKIYLHSDSQTTAGVWISSEPYVALEEDTTPAQIGLHLREVLSFSKNGVPHPTSWGDGFKPMLKIAKVRSWSQFTKNTASCSISLDSKGLKITPYNNSGKKGFFPFNERAVVVSVDIRDKELGETLLQTFELCE